MEEPNKEMKRPIEVLNGAGYEVISISNEDDIPKEGRFLRIFELKAVQIGGVKS